jgi:phosphatidylinositol 4-kinase
VCSRAFSEERTGLYLNVYEIIVTSVSSGLIEFCVETTSIDALKKKMKHLKGLRAIYNEIFCDSFEEA